jgi:hypothetical protein
MIYLDFQGSTTNNIGIETRVGTLGQIVTFNPFYQESFISSSQISLTSSISKIHGLGGTNIVPGSNNLLSNLTGSGPSINELYSFSFQYTNVNGNIGWFLVNISKAS